MAAAYERAAKRVNAVSESVLAELIERDVQQLTERALGVYGAAAWTICALLSCVKHHQSCLMKEENSIRFFPAEVRHACCSDSCYWL